MQVHKNSLDAYQSLTESGQLAGKRREVFNIVDDNGPLSSSDIGRNLVALTDCDPLVAGRSVCARLNELRAMGLVFESGTEKSKLRNTLVSVWSIVDPLPSKVNPLPKKRNVGKLVEDLRGQLIQMSKRYESHRANGGTLTAEAESWLSKTNQLLEQ